MLFGSNSEFMEVCIGGVAALVSLLFYCSSSVAVANVLGARGIVPVVSSIVLFSPVV